MGLFESLHGGTQAFERELEQFRVRLAARGFVGGDLGETGDALGLLLVRLGQFSDFRFERAQQMEEFMATLLFDGLCALNAGLDLSYGVLDHRFAFNSKFRIALPDRSASRTSGFLASASIPFSNPRQCFTGLSRAMSGSTRSPMAA